MSEPITFWVPGIPQPGGSKRGFHIAKLKRVVITDANPRAKDWKSTVALVGSQAFREPLSGPLSVRFEFLLPRPKGHIGKRGLRPGAPAYPTGRPDVLKLARSTEDALTGIAWGDDSQIVTEHLAKRYGTSGAWITIAAMGGRDG